MSAHRQHHASWNGRRPVVATRLRFVMTFLAAAAAVVCFVQGQALIALGCMNRMAGEILIWIGAVPATFLGMLCCLIGFGLHRGSIGWMRAALVFDAVIVVGLCAGLAVLAYDQVVEGDSELLSTRLLIGGGMAAVLLLCAAEAASILHACRGNALAWPAFAVLAVLAAAVTIALPPAARAAHRRHVEPLRQFATAHWFAIPPGATACVTRSPRPDGRHSDEILLRDGEWTWCVLATHEPGRGWVGGPATLMAWANGPSIEAATEWGARKRLGQVGVADRWYEPDGTHTQREHLATIRFRAPAAGGVYDVTDFGWVHFRLETSLRIPEQP